MVTPTPPDPDVGDEPSIDAILECMVSLPRRRVLFHLRQTGTATVDELVDVVARDSLEEIEGDPRIELYHRILPKLDDLGLVSFDRDDEVVELVDPTGDLGEWLDLAVGKDIEVHLDDSDAGAVEPDRDEIRVLVIDDDRGLTDVVEAYLETNYDTLSVTTATTVETALGILREESFDCIVSDLKMPEISGLDFLKAVRTEDDEMPFLLFTGEGSEAVAGEAVNNDVTGYVVKSDGPEQFDVLAGEIRSAVSKR